MKLYMHPISMTSRPVRPFVADDKIDCKERWLAAMKKRPSWPGVNQEFYGLREMIKAQDFVRV